MEKLNSMSEEWPYNLMMKFLGDEAYQKWETQIPESFFATLDYYLDTTFSARDTEIIRKYYEEHRKTQEIAKQYGLSTQSIQNILKDCLWRMAQPDTRTFLLLGMPAFLNEQKRIAYARILLDGMLGDPTLFMRSDLVTSGWELFTPLLQLWEKDPARMPLCFYPAGSEGPAESAQLLLRDGREWRPIRQG